MFAVIVAHDGMLGAEGDGHRRLTHWQENYCKQRIDRDRSESCEQRCMQSSHLAPIINKYRSPVQYSDRQAPQLYGTNREIGTMKKFARGRATNKNGLFNGKLNEIAIGNWYERYLREVLRVSNWQGDCSATMELEKCFAQFPISGRPAISCSQAEGTQTHSIGFGRTMYGRARAIRDQIASRTVCDKILSRTRLIFT